MRRRSRLLVTGPSWIGLVDLTDPTAAMPLLQHARVLTDGRGLVGVSEDGSRLVVSPLVPGGPAATAPRASAYVDSGLDGDLGQPHRATCRRPATPRRRGARVSAMTARPGRFMIVDLVGGELHVAVHEVGASDPSTSVNVGTGVRTSFTADGDVVSLESADGVLSRVVRLDPTSWRHQVYAMLVGRSHRGRPRRPPGRRRRSGPSGCGRRDAPADPVTASTKCLTAGEPACAGSAA